MADSPITAEAIQQLVAEVVRRIRAETAASAAAPAGGSTASGSSYGRPTELAGIALTETVVTLAAIERLPTAAKRVLVSATAVITPSARDRAREAGIEIVRATTAKASAAASRPFVVAHAECGADGASRCASIARSIPGSQQLPATGLADVLTALAGHASRDGARAVLLCRRPAAAVVLANRSTGLRAVTARDPASLLAAAAECSANLIVIDPKGFSAVSLDRACTDFSRRDLGAAPAELAAAPTPCACKGHTH